VSTVRPQGGTRPGAGQRPGVPGAAARCRRRRGRAAGRTGRTPGRTAVPRPVPRTCPRHEGRVVVRREHAWQPPATSPTTPGLRDCQRGTVGSGPEVSPGRDRGPGTPDVSPSRRRPGCFDVVLTTARRRDTPLHQ